MNSKGIKAFTYLYLLNPLVSFLTHLPWWYTIAAFGLIALVSAGWKFALSTVLALLFIAAGFLIYGQFGLTTAIRGWARGALPRCRP